MLKIEEIWVLIFYIFLLYNVEASTVPYNDLQRVYTVPALRIIQVDNVDE